MAPRTTREGVVAGFPAAALLVTGCLDQLTADDFAADTGIDADITILPENELRDRVTQDVATRGFGAVE